MLANDRLQRDTDVSKQRNYNSWAKQNNASCHGQRNAANAINSLIRISLFQNFPVHVQEFQFHRSFGHCHRDGFLRFFFSKKQATPDVRTLSMETLIILQISFLNKPLCYNTQQNAHIIHVHTKRIHEDW